MAPTFLNLTLPATVLVSVVIPGLPDFNILNPNRSVIELPHQRQLPNLPDGYVVYPDIGAAFKVHNVTLTWTKARRQCISEGAHLVDIDNYLKFEYVVTLAKLKKTWTGIHKMYSETEWVSSSTGLTMPTFIPWAEGEPTGEDSGYCITTDTSPRGLRNYHCGNKLPYVCEIRIPENYNAQGINKLATITAN